MKMKTLLNRVAGREDRVVVSFGDAHLLRRGNGRYELRGGSRAERQAAREWVSYFLHEAAIEW
jgi:hypothetical protein